MDGSIPSDWQLTAPRSSLFLLLFSPSDYILISRTSTFSLAHLANITTLQLPSMPPLSLQEGSGQGHCVRRHRDPPQEHWRLGAHVPHGDRHHPGRGRLRRPEDDTCQQDGPPLISKNGRTRPFFDRLSFSEGEGVLHIHFLHSLERTRMHWSPATAYFVDATKVRYEGLWIIVRHFRFIARRTALIPSHERRSGQILVHR